MGLKTPDKVVKTRKMFPQICLLSIVKPKKSPTVAHSVHWTQHDLSAKNFRTTPN